MINIELTDKEKQGLTQEEIEIAKARKLELLILPILRRNINFFYAGANIPKKANAYNAPLNLVKVESALKNGHKKVNAVCKPLCETVSKILKENGINAEPVSCDTDIFKHTDVLLTTSSNKQYIINYLEDIEFIQSGMRTPDFASVEYYKRRYEKFEDTTTTDGKKLDNIAFLSENQLRKIDKNLGYTKYNMYIDDVLDIIKLEFENFAQISAENEFIQLEIDKKMEEANGFSEEEATVKKQEIEEKWNSMSEDEILEKKLDWIFNFFNTRKNITGHADFVMYYSRLLLTKLLTNNEYQKLTRYDCFVKKDDVKDEHIINDILNYENIEDGDKLRFSLIASPNATYAISTKSDSFVKMPNESIDEIAKYAKISRTQKPSDLIIGLANKGNALPLIFNPIGEQYVNDRAKMIPDELPAEYREQEIRRLIQQIKCTDGDIKNGGLTSMIIPYPDGSKRYLYISEENEIVSIHNKNKKVFHYDEENDIFDTEKTKVTSKEIQKIFGKNDEREVSE